MLPYHLRIEPVQKYVNAWRILSCLLQPEDHRAMLVLFADHERLRRQSLNLHLERHWPSEYSDHELVPHKGVRRLESALRVLTLQLLFRVALWMERLWLVS